MPKLDEVIGKISAKTTNNKGETWMWNYDLDYAYGQARLSKEASKPCVFSKNEGEVTGHYRLKEGFYGLSDIPTVFHERIEKSIGIKNIRLTR